MPAKMTAHQRQQKRIEFFSAAQRQLMATDEFADDWYGSRDLANAMADEQMALLDNSESQSVQLPKDDGMSSWDQIVADTNSRRGFGQPVDQQTAQTSDPHGWGEVIAEVNSAIAETELPGASEPTSQRNDVHGWDEAIAATNARRS